MLDYKLLEALAMVVQEGGFDRAGRSIHLTQSAVSQRVKLLEEQTGQVLLARANPPRATPAGRRLIKHYLQVKQLEDDLRRKTEIELSKLNNQLSMEIELAKIKIGPYSERQFVIYNELWASLCELKWSMLELWSSASQQNLRKFSTQLFDAHVKFEKYALIFEENHYAEMMRCFNIFVDYEMGKKSLIEYRNNRASNPEDFQIQQMVEENRDVKNQILALIPDIRNILRQQIGSIKNAEPGA